MINLIQGDCLEVLKTIPDKSIDMVLTDPPYGTTACKWDVIIPFEPMWNELKRITKDNGAICLFGSEPFSSKLRISNLDKFRYDWIYQKACASNFAQAKIAPMKEHEVISVFSVKKHNYFPIKETRKGGGFSRVKYEFSEKSTQGNSEFVNNIRGGGNIRQEVLRFPSSIRLFNNRAKGDRGYHPTQKPVALLEYLIKTYTLENETVLDFTMGSGSTGVACKNLNRNFIGIEKDENYFKIAKERISE